MTDASVGGLIAKWRTRAHAAPHENGMDDYMVLLAAEYARTLRLCADELEAALPDLLYAAGEHASIKGLLSDANIAGLTVYQQVETLVAARTAGGWHTDLAQRFEKLRWIQHTCGGCGLRHSICHGCGGNRLTCARGEAEQCGGHQPNPCGDDCPFVELARRSLPSAPRAQ